MDSSLDIFMWFLFLKLYFISLGDKFMQLLHHSVNLPLDEEKLIQEANELESAAAEKLRYEIIDHNLTKSEVEDLMLSNMRYKGF